MKWGLGLFVTLVLFACTSKMQKWEREMQSAIATSDSTAFILNTIDPTELQESTEAATVLWNMVKIQFKQDTLSIEALRSLDAFNVAYKNSKELSTEYSHCKSAEIEQKKRLILLQSDIQNASGDRSTYCASIQKEIEELTIIRMHAIDIRRRFDELKTSMEQFQPLLAR